MLSGAYALRAMLDGRRAPAVGTLRTRSRKASDLAHAGRYGDLADLLRGLVPDLESAARAVPQDRRPEVFELMAATYQACSAALAKLGEPGAVWIAADRAMAAAERAGNPMLVAAGAFRLVFVFISARHYDQSTSAMQAARYVPPPRWIPTACPQLSGDSPLRQMPSVVVCEAALAPSPGAVSLLFPVADDELDRADPVRLAVMPRPLPLVYIGNQYDRDEVFGAFFAPAAARFEHRVAGKWTRTADWPHVSFTGRCPFPHVRELYESALATVLLVPDRYARAGQMTQRLFEAVLAGCLPVTPDTIPSAAVFTPPALHAATGQLAANRVAGLLDIAGTARHAELIAACLDRLGVFRLSRQLRTLDQILRRLTNACPACPQPGATTGR